VDRTTAAARKWTTTINDYTALVAEGVSVCIPSNVATSLENVTGSVFGIS
jgi:hypothetical protein